VTHQLGFISRADQIVLLKNGELIAKGSYNDLITSQPDLINSLNTDQKKKGQQTQEHLNVPALTLASRSNLDLRCGSQSSIASMTSRVIMEVI
jgi:ABC-type multidrug transport system ATPase subunit